LSEGADPNQKNDKGTTPLMSLALTKEIEAIKTLLDNKGDPEVVNNNGLNTLAASLVQKYDVPSIVELILEYGCDTNSIVVINDRELNMKELAERKNKHQSLIVLNRPEFNKE
jgi:ankyrin repeat protein